MRLRNQINYTGELILLLGNDDDLFHLLFGFFCLSSVMQVVSF